MSAQEKKVRAAVTIGFFAISFVALFYYTYGSFFCSRPGASSHVAQTLRLTIACTLWEVFVSIGGAFVGKKCDARRLAPVLSTALALMGFASIPSWIYKGGRFMFEGTWADVSCFFTEGYGMMFPVFVAPILAAATLAGEFVILKLNVGPKSALRLVSQ